MSLSRRFGWTAMLLLGIAIAGYALHYASIDFSQVNGPVRTNAAELPSALLIHVAAAAVALLIGPWQFLARLRANRPHLHRTLGRFYVIACLLGGLSGLMLAMNTGAGWAAKLGFAGLAIAWLTTTGMAYVAVRKRDLIAHRQWMLRSFALTLAAVTLRLYIPIALIAGFDFMIAYRAISWLCWVPNLLIAEWLFVRSIPLAMPIVE